MRNIRSTFKTSRYFVSAAMVSVTLATSTLTPVALPVAVAADSASGLHDISTDPGVTFSNFRFYKGVSEDAPLLASGAPYEDGRMRMTIAGDRVSTGDVIYYSLESRSHGFYQKYAADADGNASPNFAFFTPVFYGERPIKLDGSNEVVAKLSFDNGRYKLKFIKDIDNFKIDVVSLTQSSASFSRPVGSPTPSPNSETNDTNLVIGLDSPKTINIDHPHTITSYPRQEPKPYKPSPTEAKEFSCGPSDVVVDGSRSVVSLLVNVNGIKNTSDEDKIAKVYVEVPQAQRPILVKEWVAMYKTLLGQSADLSELVEELSLPYVPKSDLEQPLFGSGLFTYGSGNTDEDKSSQAYTSQPLTEKDGKFYAQGGFKSIYFSPASLNPQFHDIPGGKGIEFSIPVKAHQQLGSLAIRFIGPYRGAQKYTANCNLNLVDPNDATATVSYEPGKGETASSSGEFVDVLEIPDLIYGDLRIASAPTAATVSNPVYDDSVVYRTDSVTLKPYNAIAAGGKDGDSKDRPLPEGTWSLIGDKPSWVTLVDPATGELSATPPKGTTIGDYNFTVKLSLTDDTFVMVPAKVTVKDLAAKYTLKGQNGTVAQGSSATLPAPEGLDLNDVESITIADGAPAFVSIDSATKGLVAKPSLTTEQQDYDVPLTITYKDGSTATVTDTVTVTAAEENSKHDFSFPSDVIDVYQGDTVQSSAPTLSPGADSVTFALKDALDWVSIDPTTGVITAKPGKEQQAKAYPFVVTATYGDNSVDETTVTVNVKPLPTAVTVTPSPVTVTPEPVTQTVTVTPEPVTSVVTMTPEPSTVAAEPVTTTVTVTAQPVVTTVVQTPAPVTVTNTVTSAVTTTVEQAPVSTVITVHPQPTTVVNLTTVAGEPTEVTQTIVPDPVVATVSATPAPVTVTLDPTTAPAPTTTATMPAAEAVDGVNSTELFGESDGSSSSSSSSSSGWWSIALAILGFGGLLALIARLVPLIAPAVSAPAPAPAPTADPDVVVHPDGTVCPANDHVKGLCRSK